MTRFRKVDKPETVPHYDIHDRDSTNPVWDMGVDLEGHSGAVYIKEHYIQEIARLTGMVPGDKYETLKKENELLKKRLEVSTSLEEIPAKLGELHNELNVYLAAYRSESVDSEYVGSSSDSVSENIEDEGYFNLDLGEGSKLS